jgi:LPS export ABC transporter permease LptG/LPS export ABC transporter permease LptF
LAFLVASRPAIPVRILFRYVLRETLVTALIGSFVFTFVLFLPRIGGVMELLIRPGPASGDILHLFLLMIPQLFRFSIPMGVLVGVLVGLGRLSSDREITAMRAAGIPGGRCVLPVGVLALVAAGACATTTLYLNPIAQREFHAIAETLKISQATAEVPPRVFIEEFPNRVLYVRDVVAGPVVHWKGVFLADMRSPEERGSLTGVSGAVDGPRITVAPEAIVVPRPEQDRLQLTLPTATVFEESFDPTQYHTGSYEQGDQVLETRPADLAARARPFEWMDMASLFAAAKDGEEGVTARIELHQRFAFPLACLILPLVGIPLSISTQRAGKSVGIVFSALLSFVYWMVMIGGVALAKERLLPVWLAIWMANLLFAAAGLFLLSQLDAPNRRDFVAATAGRVRLWLARLRSSGETRPAESPNGSAARGARGRKNGISETEPPLSLPFIPIVDRYVLQRFLFFLGVLIATFVSIWFVFSFFELLSDMLAREKMASFVPYLYYLTPWLVYETTPLAVLVATLVCFGLLARHHELTAFKACGVSVYRLAAPVLLSAVALSGFLFALDYYYLPETNRKQDAIRDEIKGRPVRTFLRPDRQWTAGRQDRIFYHRFFDSRQKMLAGVKVYDFAPEPFRLRRHISAERARWDDTQRSWVFENGWVRDLDGDQSPPRFEQFQVRAFPDLEEEPSYFLKEERQHQQMNWTELSAYILDLTQSGFDTVRLQVQRHKKLSFPFFALSMAILAIPFSISSGHRSSLSPVAFGIGLAIAYYALNSLFEQLGRAGQLSPAIAAWAPSLIFALSGAYLILKIRS